MRLISFGPRGSEIPGALVDDAVLPLGRVLADIGLRRTGSLRSVLPFLGLLGEGIDARTDRQAPGIGNSRSDHEGHY